MDAVDSVTLRREGTGISFVNTRSVVKKRTRRSLSACGRWTTDPSPGPACTGRVEDTRSTRRTSALENDFNCGLDAA